ncbi:MAG TPA: hypothetical protein VK144_08890, partial [Bacillota bacterium]|nr:hypothetical protein [Bacillota bacterium]
MSTSKKSNQSMDNVHNDKDLIQLAGYHAYRSYKKRDEIEVNNKLFFVENVIKDTDTGFEALVVRNITPDENGKESHDGELIIVYVGSRPEPSDWATNVDLLKD